MREFFERTTLKEDFEEIVKDYEDLKNEEAVMYKVEYIDTKPELLMNLNSLMTKTMLKNTFVN